MTVYVDDGKYVVRTKRGERWLSSHMMADTHDELIDMAEAIDCNIQWIQSPGEKFEHFDITQQMKHRAISHGAVAISQRQLVAIMGIRKDPG